MTAEEVFHANMKLVPYVFNKYIVKTKQALLEQEDLFQVGYIGLWGACKRYSDEKGAKFSTYAVTCILGKMQRHLIVANRYANATASMETPLYKQPGESMKMCDILPDLKTQREIDMAGLGIRTFLERHEMLRKQTEGYTTRELGAAYGKSATWVSWQLRKQREELKNEIGERRI